jgi:hypothetical protein
MAAAKSDAGPPHHGGGLVVYLSNRRNWPQGRSGKPSFTRDRPAPELLLLALVRQCVEPLGDLDQSRTDTEHACTFGHATIRSGLRSKVSDRSIGTEGDFTHFQIKRGSG